ncbi:uncharacterized protein LOC114320846 isoform X2 [Camellia sinensis]|nr:uncharacterized protein LOC114320846 isoform X2 [Camellia sinensis]
MAPSFDYTVSSLLCAEGNDNISDDEVDCAAVKEHFEPTWHHRRNHQENLKVDLFSVPTLICIGAREKKKRDDIKQSFQSAYPQSCISR